MSQKGIPLTQQHRDRISAGVKAAWVKRKASSQQQQMLAKLYSDINAPFAGLDNLIERADFIRRARSTKRKTFFERVIAWFGGAA